MIKPKWAMAFVLLGILIASITPLTSAKGNQPLVVMGGMLIMVQEQNQFKMVWL